jgi:lipoyl synthase
LPVVQYLTPERFIWFKEITEPMGFKYVAAGPLVRSSYRAGELFLEKVIRHPSM